MYWTHCTFVKICTMVSHVFSRHWDPFCLMEDGKMPPLPQGSASEQKPPLSSLRKGRTWGACTLTRSQIFEELSKIPKNRKCNNILGRISFANDLWLDGVFTSKFMVALIFQVEANVPHPWKKRWVSKGICSAWPIKDRGNIGKSWKECRGIRFLEFIYVVTC